jgi:hypothetical protein
MMAIVELVILVNLSIQLSLFLSIKIKIPPCRGMMLSMAPPLPVDSEIDYTVLAEITLKFY